MKCQILFHVKKKKKKKNRKISLINLSSAELDHRVAKVRKNLYTFRISVNIVFDSSQKRCLL